MTTTDVKALIYDEASKYIDINDNQWKTDVEVIYDNLCNIYTEESVLDGEYPYLWDCIECECEIFYNL